MCHRSLRALPPNHGKICPLWFALKPKIKRCESFNLCFCPIRVDECAKIEQHAGALEYNEWRESRWRKRREFKAYSNATCSVRWSTIYSGYLTYYHRETLQFTHVTIIEDRNGGPYSNTNRLVTRRTVTNLDITAVTWNHAVPTKYAVIKKINN